MEITQKLGAAASAAALSFGATALAQDAVQWRVEDGGNGHWYAVVPNFVEQRSWAACRDFSVSLGGHLVTLGSADENALVAAIALQFEWAWSNHPDGFGPLLGGYQVDGAEEPAIGWRWVNDERWSYSNWNPGEPNNSGCGTTGGESVLAFTARSGVWNDLHPTPTSCVGWLAPSFIIEFEADCNSDGIVDFGQIRAGQLPDANANGIPDGCETDNGGPSPAIQWHPKSGGNGHWYAAVAAPTPISWSGARDAAASQGGHLATLHSQAEDQFVSAIALGDPAAWPLADRYGPWLGGYQTHASDDPHENWAWVTGEPWSYVSELVQFDNSSRPDGQHDDYLHYIDHSRIWNDVREDGDIYYGIGIRSYLVEWSADCNNDGVVDFGQIRAGELEDTNHNNIPDCCEGTGSCNCPGDVARDGVVNGIDLAAVLNNWGTTGGVINADANHDGTVDATDLAIVLGGWGACP